MNATESPLTPEPAVARRRQRITLADGRTVSFSCYGAEDGHVSVLVQDGPGSRGLAAAAGPIAATMGFA